MTDLTEQWKKGELPEGEYWVKYTYGDIERLDYFWKTFNDNGYPINNETIEQVLAPVPTYEEWKQLKGLLKELRMSVMFDKDLVEKIDEVL